jgi:hypothetical protein
MTPRYRTRREAAKYLTEELGLPITWTTLQKLACTGGGPPYRIFGNRALYTDEDLDAWAEARMSPLRTSTSEQHLSQPEVIHTDDPSAKSAARASGEKPENQRPEHT